MTLLQSILFSLVSVVVVFFYCIIYHTNIAVAVAIGLLIILCFSLIVVNIYSLTNSKRVRIFT